MTTQSRAQELSSAFERRNRDDGSEFVALKPGSPEWMTDVIRTAHGEMFPDDWRYLLIERAADALADNDNSDAARDSLEPDVYTGRLADWLASRADRYAYCDEAMDELGAAFDGTFALLQLGQQWELEEVFAVVLSAIEELEGISDD